MQPREPVSWIPGVDKATLSATEDELFIMSTEGWGTVLGTLAIGAGAIYLLRKLYKKLTQGTVKYYIVTKDQNEVDITKHNQLDLLSADLKQAAFLALDYKGVTRMAMAGKTSLGRIGIDIRDSDLRATFYVAEYEIQKNRDYAIVGNASIITQTVGVRWLTSPKPTYIRQMTGQQLLDMINSKG